MKLCLLDTDYTDENGKSVIRLFCKDKNGKTIVALDYNFEPYFYILPKQGKENEVKKKVEEQREIKIKRAEIVEKIISGEKRNFVKVFCFLSTDVPKVRDIAKRWEKERGGTGIVEEEYEYSLSFYKRWLIDHQVNGMGWIDIDGEEIKGNYQADNVIKIKKIKSIESDEIPELKLMAFDIECIEENGKQKIVMLSMKGKNFEKVLTYQKDKHYGKYVEVVKDEKEILEKFVEIVNKQDCDLLLGFNSDLFDMQIIQQRAAELKVKLVLSRDFSELKFARRARISSARLKGRIHIDLFEFVNNILSPQLQTEVLTLDAISAELLGDKKIEIEYEEILESWRKGKDLAKLAEYCLKDSELTLRLGEFILPQIYELSRLSGQLPFDTSRMTYSQLVEWYLSKRAFVMNYIIPNQPKWEEIQTRREVSPYVGGFVKEPIAGLHEDIAVMDFRSLYPSIIATFNISPENLNCLCCRKDGYEVPETKYWFCKRKKGFVSTVVKELIEKRKKIKESMKRLKKNSDEWKRLDNEQFATKTISNALYGSYAFSGAKWYCRECCTGNTIITLENGQNVTIKEYIERNMKDKVLTLDSDLKIFPSLVKETYKIKAPSKLFKVVTRSGRTLTLTTDNELPLIKSDGSIEWKPVCNVKAGEFLITPRKFNIKNSLIKTTDYLDDNFIISGNKISLPHCSEINIPVTIGKNLAYVSGLLNSDGHFHKNNIKLSFTNNEESLHKSLIDAIATLGLTSSRYKNETYFSRKTLYAFLTELISKTPLLTNNLLKAYLRGIADGDGSIWKDKKGYAASIACGTESSNAILIQNLLLRFGIFGIIEEVKPKKGGKAKGRIIIGKQKQFNIKLNGNDALNFCNVIGFNHPRKRKIMKDAINFGKKKKYRSYLDVMPIGLLIKKARLENRLGVYDLSNNTHHYEKGITFPSRKIVEKMTTKLRINGPHTLKIKKLVESEILCDRVKKVEKIENDEEYVYDLTTEHGNFMANNIIMHNCAEAAASFGRLFIREVINKAEKEDFIVIYADTDSMFVKSRGNLIKKTDVFIKKVNKELPGIIELDLQGIYKRGIFIPKGIGPGTAKKRYALINDKGILTVRGLETVRRDWCKLAKDVQRKVLEFVLEKKDVKGSVKYVQDIIKKLKQEKIPLKELTIYEQLTKPLSEYKAIGPHVAAAKKIKERGRPIGEGMVIMFIITKGKGSISERAEPIEDVEIKDIDVDYYVTHQIVPAALRVLTVLGVTEEQLLGESLKSFIKK